ncbi:hypothetical protein B0H14DRAFT_3869969, partial [Mycena olivaceomarginata]
MANTPPTNAQGTLPSSISTQHADLKMSSAHLSPTSQSLPPGPAPLSRAFICALAVITLLPVGTLARLELLPARVLLMVGVAAVDHEIEDRNIVFTGAFLSALIFGVSWAEFGYLSMGAGAVLGVLAFYIAALHRRRIEDLGMFGAPLMYI